MAKLYFYYSAMNAGKTTTLLQSAYNYNEKGMDALLLTAHLDDRVQMGLIASRIGLARQAELYAPPDDLFLKIQGLLSKGRLHCVLVDEAQFLTPEQVWQLARVVDEANVPVLCYGIRTDYAGELFPGSAALLAVADVLTEIKTICLCGSKATMNLRLTEGRRVVLCGEQIAIGGNESYEAMCRKCFTQARRRGFL